MLDAITELITHESQGGDREWNYVCTDTARKSFHRLLESKEWKADKGGRYLNTILDRFIEPMEEHRDLAYKRFHETPHGTIEWNKADRIRKTIAILYNKVFGLEGTMDRDELVDFLRKEIANRAYV